MWESGHIRCVRAGRRHRFSRQAGHIAFRRRGCAGIWFARECPGGPCRSIEPGPAFDFIEDRNSPAFPPDPICKILPRHKLRLRMNKVFQHRVGERLAPIRGLPRRSGGDHPVNLADIFHLHEILELCQVLGSRLCGWIRLLGRAGLRRPQVFKKGSRPIHQSSPACPWYRQDGKSRLFHAKLLHSPPFGQDGCGG